MLRVLRPLRMISKNEGLKLCVLSLMNSMSGIMNGLLIASLFFILFAIFGTHYLKGQYYYCVTENIESIGIEMDSLSTKWDCLNAGGDWMNRTLNFDNIFQSLMMIFILTFVEGWTELMFNAIDSRGIDLIPRVDSNDSWSIFFMAFMIIGSSFTLNLFVSIVVNTYYAEKSKLD